MNILNAINYANQQLKEKGIKTYQLDSQILMSKAIKKKKEKILLNLEEEIKTKDYNYFIDLINQRLNMKPIAYLVGSKSFWKYDFQVTNDVLIPRPDTEIIIEQVMKLREGETIPGAKKLGPKDSAYLALRSSYKGAEYSGISMEKIEAAREKIEKMEKLLQNQKKLKAGSKKKKQTKKKKKPTKKKKKPTKKKKKQTKKRKKPTKKKQTKNK